MATEQDVTQHPLWHLWNALKAAHRSRGSAIQHNSDQSPQPLSPELQALHSQPNRSQVTEQAIGGNATSESTTSNGNTAGKGMQYQPGDGEAVFWSALEERRQEDHRLYDSDPAEYWRRLNEQRMAANLDRLTNEQRAQVRQQEEEWHAEQRRTKDRLQIAAVEAQLGKIGEIAHRELSTLEKARISQMYEWGLPGVHLAVPTQAGNPVEVPDSAIDTQPRDPNTPRPASKTQPRSKTVIVPVLTEQAKGGFGNTSELTEKGKRAPATQRRR